MTDDLFAKLAAPFPPERVSWRVGSTTQDKKKGLALAYVDARDVMDRLDVLCGPAGWQCRYPHANGKTVCEIGIKVGDEWIWKADGAGDTDVEAEKGALSDAFKRAAVRWGVGRYLYDVTSPWVELEPAGRSFKIKDSEIPKLRKVLEGKPTPAPEPKYKQDAETIKVAIDKCATIEAVNELLRVEKETIEEIGKHSKPAADFLTDRAKKKIALLGNAPQKAA